MTLFLDYGFNLRGLVLSKEVKDKINKELSSMLFAKLILTIILLIFMILFLFINNYDYNTKILILILGLSSIPNSFGIFFLNNFKIFGRFDKESLGYLIQGVSLIFCLSILEYLDINSLFYYSSVLLLSRFLFFLFGMKTFLGSEKFTIIRVDYQKAYTSLKTTFPYAVHLILSSIIIYIDTFILSYLTSLYNVGLYQSGMRMIMASLLISIIISDAFVPEISKIFKDRRRVTFRLGLLTDFLAVFSIIMGMTLYFYKETIILILFSREYLLLQNFIFYILLIITLRYIGIVPGIILTTGNKQKIRALGVLVSFVCSIILNFTLIPILGLEGAFISSLIAHIILNSIYLFYSAKEINFYNDISFLFIFFMLTIFIFINISFFNDSMSYFLVTIALNLLTIFLYYKYRIYKSSNNQLLNEILKNEI